jgi:3-mercaptopyruvate sulfurtransferase SseA
MPGGHDVENTPPLFNRAYVRHHLPQAIAAQAIAAIERHRQPRHILGAPARFSQAAGEFRSAAGTSQPAQWWIFQLIGHPNQICPRFHVGSCRTAV